MHWDGTTWSLAPAPGGRVDPGDIGGIAAATSNDVWAIGQNSGSWHWDGTSWSLIDATIRAMAITTVSDGADRHVWVVGPSQANTLTARFCGPVTTPALANLPAAGGPPSAQDGGLALVPAGVLLLAAAAAFFVVSGLSARR